MARNTKKNVPSAPSEPTTKTIETFCPPWRTIAELTRSPLDSPSCFNRAVHVRRYRVVAELIEEPIEIIRERLLALWAMSTNHHDANPLKEEAHKYGLTFDKPQGWNSKKS